MDRLQNGDHFVSVLVCMMYRSLTDFIGLNQYKYMHISWAIDLLHKCHNTAVLYPTIQHFVKEMCTRVHIFVTIWCIVGYLSNALWDLWDGSIVYLISHAYLSGRDWKSRFKYISYVICIYPLVAWWVQGMVMLSVFLVLCEGNQPVTSGLPSSVTCGFSLQRTSNARNMNSVLSACTRCKGLKRHGAHVT